MSGQNKMSKPNRVPALVLPLMVLILLIAACISLFLVFADFEKGKSATVSASVPSTISPTVSLTRTATVNSGSSSSATPTLALKPTASLQIISKGYLEPFTIVTNISYPENGGCYLCLYWDGKVTVMGEKALEVLNIIKDDSFSKEYFMVVQSTGGGSLFSAPTQAFSSDSKAGSYLLEKKDNRKVLVGKGATACEWWPYGDYSPRFLHCQISNEGFLGFEGWSVRKKGGSTIWSLVHSAVDDKFYFVLSANLVAQK